MKFLFSVFAMVIFCHANGQVWETDVESALQKAKLTDKKVIIFFTVNKCQVCDSLVKNVLSTEEFISFTRTNYILVKIDFSPSNGIDVEQSSDLLLIVEKYNKDGFFPFVVEVDKSGKILVKQPAYEGESAKEYLDRFQ